VRVSERVALARLGEDDRRYHLAVDRKGHVLGPSARAPHLPALVGLRDMALRPGDEIDDPAVKAALEVLDRCDTTRLSQVIKIKVIDVAAADRLNLVLAQGERIELGLDQLEWRLGRLARAIQEAAGAGRIIEYADFSIDKNVPIRYRPSG
jgi:cell division septal protein FtsQ